MGAEAHRNLSFWLSPLILHQCQADRQLDRRRQYWAGAWLSPGRVCTCPETCLPSQPSSLIAGLQERKGKEGSGTVPPPQTHTHTHIHPQLANSPSSSYGMTDAACDVMPQSPGHDCWDCWTQSGASKRGRNIPSISRHNNTHDCLQTGGEGDARGDVVLKDNELLRTGLVLDWISHLLYASTAKTEGAAYAGAHEQSSLWETVVSRQVCVRGKHTPDHHHEIKQEISISLSVLGNEILKPTVTMTEEVRLHVDDRLLKCDDLPFFSIIVNWTSLGYYGMLTLLWSLNEKWAIMRAYSPSSRVVVVQATCANQRLVVPDFT